MAKLNLLYISFGICVFPLIIFLFCLITNETPYITGILSEIGSSMNDYPLIELEYNESCSQDKYISSLYIMPGSSNGCSCADVKEYKFRQANEEIVSQGLCKENQTLNGCENIYEVPASPLYKWSSGEFCSKKYNKKSEDSENGYRRYFSDSVGQNEKCAEGFKKCGKLDDVGNYLCLPENETCPINDIIISTSPLSNLDNYNFTKFDDKYLYYTNKAKDLPIITKLKVVEGKLCADKTYFHTDYPQFILDNNFEYYGCRHQVLGSIYDSVQPIDTRTKYQLYIDNNISLSTLYPISSEFPYPSFQAEMVMYSKNYVGYDKQCLKDNNFNLNSPILDESNINEMNDNINNNRFYNSLIMKVSLGALFVYFLLCLFINIDEEKSFSYLIMWSFIIFIFIIGLNVICILSLVCVYKLDYFPVCGSESTNKKIIFFNDNEYKLFKNTIITLIFINLQIIFVVAMFFIKKYKNAYINDEILSKKSTKKESNRSSLTEIPSIINNDSFNDSLYTS